MEETLILAGRIFDGVADAPLENAYVVVGDGRIRGVGPRSELAVNLDRFAHVLELAPDSTLLPGLINMHVHMSFSSGPDVMGDHLRESEQTRTLRAVENLKMALATGVTTVRDCATCNPVAFAVRAAVESGIMRGPRVIAAGEGITSTGGHCWFCSTEADSEVEVRKAVRAQAKAGADFIKLFSTGGNTTPGTNALAAQFSEAEMCAATEEARRLGLRTASHAHGTPGVRNSIAARVTTIEHCSFLEPDGMHYDAEQVQIIADEGIYVCPTLFRAGTKGLDAADPGLSEAQQALFRTQKMRAELVSRLAGQGVKIISGTDAGVAHNTFADYPGDLALSVEAAGLSPLYVLKSATSVAAEALGLPELGHIAEGKAADLLAVQGNPLEDIHALEQPRMVMARGRLVT